MDSPSGNDLLEFATVWAETADCAARRKARNAHSKSNLMQMKIIKKPVVRAAELEARQMRL